MTGASARGARCGARVVANAIALRLKLSVLRALSASLTADGLVAQRLEPTAHNGLVGGSSPSRPTIRAAGKAAIIETFAQPPPSFPGLAFDIGLGGFPPGVERVELPLKTGVAGDAGVDGTTQNFYGHCGVWRGRCKLAKFRPKSPDNAAMCCTNKDSSWTVRLERRERF